jgi:hypothetical protein
LRYNEVLWLRIDDLEKHWDETRIEAEIIDKNHVHVKTKNVSRFTVSFASGQCPFDVKTPTFSIDPKGPEEGPLYLGGNMVKPHFQSDRSWSISWGKTPDGTWVELAPRTGDSPYKHHGLQGPIDDAFMDRFIMVAPTGTPLHEKTGNWVNAEMAHAIDHWRRQFRGEAIVKKDTEITDDDIKSSNLVLWGDPASNKILERIAAKLPLNWDGKLVRLGSQEYDAGHHVPVLIYPNPLNPKKYVVLNSGFTFREYDYENNARQVPKLPDYAVIDISKPVTIRHPGGIAAAGFFDEEWKVTEKK